MVAALKRWWVLRGRDLPLDIWQGFWSVIPHRHKPYLGPNSDRMFCARCGRVVTW